MARRIAGLEQRLGLKLIDRRGRWLVLTPDGERVANVIAGMAADLRAIERLAGSARSDVTGQVAVSAPPAYAMIIVAPKLVALRRTHPGVSVRLLGETRPTSLAKREADIAIRLRRPETGELTTTKFGSMTFGLYASPGYLAETSGTERVFIGSTGPMAGSSQQVAMERIAAGSTFGFCADHAELQLALAAAASPSCRISWSRVARTSWRWLRAERYPSARSG